jgi:hypothetical protein
VVSLEFKEMEKRQYTLKYEIVLNAQDIRKLLWFTKEGNQLRTDSNRVIDSRYATKSSKPANSTRI